jgi:NTP pyrophosphatase (non-canonical NTP hydrolase)
VHLGLLVWRLALRNRTIIVADNCAIQSLPLDRIRAREQAIYSNYSYLHIHINSSNVKRKMTIKEAQQTVDQWIKQYGVRYFSELTNMACLTEEVGELARVIARTYGDQSFKKGEKPNLGEEMADVLWVLICLANQTGIDLTEELKKSFEKKTKRDCKRHKENAKLREA